MPSRPPDPPRLRLLPDPDEIDEEAIEEQAARATSREMWRVLSAGTTYAKLTAALEFEYVGDIERAGRDIDQFIVALREFGLQAG